jgi:hypothetical protein
VADLYQGSPFRIPRPKDLARAHFALTDVQWFYAVHPWFPVATVAVIAGVLIDVDALW